MDRIIYKIATKAQWAEAGKTGVFAGAPVDLADGYIHFSTAAQARETAAKHFAGQDDLLLVAVEAAKLGEALKWEVSRGGALFPHGAAYQTIYQGADFALYRAKRTGRNSCEFNSLPQVWQNRDQAPPDVAVKPDWDAA